MSFGWCEDFSYGYYRRVLAALGVRFTLRLLGEAKELSDWTLPSVFLRHDVDISLQPAVKLAALEHDAGVLSTYMVMARGQLYDITEADSARMLREIAAMGHEIGVHFDCPEEIRAADCGIDGVESLIVRDCKRLEDVIGSPVHSMSFHRPVPWLLRGPLLVCGKVNAYAAPLMGWYLSDSKGSWRAGEPLSQLCDPAGAVLQLLTHPIWWGSEHQHPAERLEFFFRTETSRMTAQEADGFDRLLVTVVPGIRRSGQPARSEP